MRAKRTDESSDTPCWIWSRRRDLNDYGVVWHGGRMQKAHRMVYEQLIGPIPEGLELDHLCRVRACVNPDHLEPVTSGENTRRANASKLAETLTAMISEDYVFGLEDQKSLALKYGVTEDSVRLVIAGEIWKPDPRLER